MLEIETGKKPPVSRTIRAFGLPPPLQRRRRPTCFATMVPSELGSQHDLERVLFRLGREIDGEAESAERRQRGAFRNHPTSKERRGNRPDNEARHVGGDCGRGADDALDFQRVHEYRDRRVVRATEQHPAPERPLTRGLPAQEERVVHKVLGSASRTGGRPWSRVRHRA